MYRFKVGSKVKHESVESLEGTIIKLVSFDEEEGVRIDVEDPDCPWYDIEWIDGSQGFEHDLSLVQ